MAKPDFAGQPTIQPTGPDTFEFHVGRISGEATVDLDAIPPTKWNFAL
jgi:hypothetical protein